MFLIILHHDDFLREVFYRKTIADNIRYGPKTGRPLSHATNPPSTVWKPPFVLAFPLFFHTFFTFRKSFVRPSENVNVAFTQTINLFGSVGARPHLSMFSGLFSDL